MKNLWRCEECREVMDENDFLKAKNPFDKTEEIYGCPNCKTIDSFVQICDVEGCNIEATCGTPTKDGYRRTCGFHQPDAWFKWINKKVTP